jgi:proton-dependent oligopeptide transporter, POT family
MSEATPEKRDELLGHPRGLFVLFMVEMWERFSYYGMRAILTLYMKAPKVPGVQGGLGWAEGKVYSVYGWYTMAVYVASIPGGWLADRVLGQKRAVMLGGLLLCAGHGIMAVPGTTTFYTALSLIVAGVGLLKPNISTMVGGLYDAGDPRRDRGFTVFYIGINLGAFLAGIIVGYVGEKIGWHYGFGLAGIGMALGQLQFFLGGKHLRGIGESIVGKGTTGDTNISDAPLTDIEKDRIKVLLLSFLMVIVFWGSFEQAGGLMNIYTKEKVDRLLLGYAIPASWFQSLNPLFIILFGNLVAAFWAKRKAKGKEASGVFKMAIGTMIMGSGFLWMVGASVQVEATAKAGMYWLVFAYLFHTIGELSSSPVALSFITKLAPAKYGSQMMGLYFAVTGVGNKVAGLLGEASAKLGEKIIFLGITGVCFAFAIAILLFVGKLNRMTHGAEDEAV